VMNRCGVFLKLYRKQHVARHVSFFKFYMSAVFY
jgi:hypothetical protein